MKIVGVLLVATDLGDDAEEKPPFGEVNKAADGVRIAILNERKVGEMDSQVRDAWRR